MQKINLSKKVMNQDHKVLLYDGNCSLCISFANFLGRKDKKRVLSLITLQSAESCLAGNSACDGYSCVNTVVFIDGGRVFTKSAAVLAAVAELGGIWRALSFLKIFPRPLRDSVYNLIARNRLQISKLFRQK